MSRHKEMTLTNRLSLFFLTTLALVLAGFSSALYLLARSHLYHQAEERLEAAFNTLAASVEVRPDGLEWELAERRLILGGAAEGQLVWVVTDQDGRVVDQSMPPAADFVGEAADRLRAADRSSKRLDWRGERWQFRQERMQAANPANPSGPSRRGAEVIYPALSITAGISLEPVRATLRGLAWVLVGLSLGVWLVALLLGRVVCRRALRPVTRMAASARGMSADDFGQRLPTVQTGDELDDLSRAFNGLLDRLQESFERQRRFTGEASHQLRTPLTAMLGQVEVALRRERPAEEYQRVLSTVRRQAERLRRIVESLLFLARADTEARLPDHERLDLRTWLAGHIGAWSGHARAGDLVVDAGGTEPACVEVQPVLLGELVDILLDNACKYSPPGKPITIRLQQSKEAVELSVQDEGPGIRGEDLPQLFSPFFRSPEARRRGVEGLGLGLAIARRVAHAFGGELTVASEVGQGSCFTLRLPVAESAGPRKQVSEFV